VTRISPTSARQEQLITLQIWGEGFIYVRDGSTVNPRVDEGHLIRTHVIPPNGINGLSGGQVSDEDITIVNSTFLTVDLGISWNLPAGDYYFVVCNPPLDRDFSLNWNLACEEQNDQAQEDTFYFSVQERERTTASRTTTTTTTSSEDGESTSTGGGCVIATAAYGSEIEPEVQFLRDFRDKEVRSTFSGSSFMVAFNSFYYSWSPPVADAIRDQDTMRGVTRGLITPLLAILSFSSAVNEMLNTIPEIGVIAAGFVASSLIGIVYLGPPLTVGLALTHRIPRYSTRIRKGALFIVGLVALGFAVTLLGAYVGSALSSMVGSATFVLSSIILSTASVYLAILFIRRGGGGS
jgi:hypothetical protein